MSSHSLRMFNGPRVIGSIPIKVEAPGKPFHEWKFPNYAKDSLRPSTNSSHPSLSYQDFHSAVCDINWRKFDGEIVYPGIIEAFWVHVVNTHFSHENEQCRLNALMTTISYRLEEALKNVRCEECDRGQTRPADSGYQTEEPTFARGKSYRRAMNKNTRLPMGRMSITAPKASEGRNGDLVLACKRESDETSSPVWQGPPSRVWRNVSC